MVLEKIKTFIHRLRTFGVKQEPSIVDPHQLTDDKGYITSIGAIGFMNKDGDVTQRDTGRPFMLGEGWGFCVRIENGHPICYPEDIDETTGDRLYCGWTIKELYEVWKRPEEFLINPDDLQ